MIMNISKCQIVNSDLCPTGYASSSAPFVPGAIYYNPNLPTTFYVDVGDMTAGEAKAIISEIQLGFMQSDADGPVYAEDC